MNADEADLFLCTNEIRVVHHQEYRSFDKTGIVPLQATSKANYTHNIAQLEQHIIPATPVLPLDLTIAFP